MELANRHDKRERQRERDRLSELAHQTAERSTGLFFFEVFEICKFSLHTVFYVLFVFILDVAIGGRTFQTAVGMLNDADVEKRRLQERQKKQRMHQSESLHHEEEEKPIHEVNSEKMITSLSSLSAIQSTIPFTLEQFRKCVVTRPLIIEAC